MPKPKVISEAGKHYIQLTEVLRKNSALPDSSTASPSELCKEWIVSSSRYEPDAGLKCLCGKEEVAHVNVLINVHNGVLLDPIGSQCVKRFGIPDLGLLCKCCAKPIHHGNAFVDAYMKKGPITKQSDIIGHVHCARKFAKDGSWYNWNYHTWTITMTARAYFEALGITASMDRYGNYELEYDDPSLTPYVDMLNL